MIDLEKLSGKTYEELGRIMVDKILEKTDEIFKEWSNHITHQIMNDVKHTKTMIGRLRRDKRELNKKLWGIQEEFREYKLIRRKVKK